MTPIPASTQAQAAMGYGWTVAAQNAPRIASAGPGAWFGPWQPLAPMAPPGTGGRAFDYRTGENLQYIPRGEGRASFEELRALVDSLSILGTVIEKRKDQIAGWEWDIMPKLAGKDRRQTAIGVAGDEDNRISATREFLRRPDRRQPFHTWLRKLLDDMLVIDAATICPRLTRGGGLYSLDVVDGSCYSEDTEVLTRAGWKRFSQVSIDTDEFATRSIATKIFEWQKATYFHEADYVGTMHRFHSRAVDILVSPNHRMLVSALPRKLGGSRHRHGGEVVVKAADLASALSGAIGIPMTSQWQGVEIGEKRFATDDPRSAKTVMSGDDYCAFMGAYLAEGSGNSESVYITQAPASKGFAPFRELLDRVAGCKVLHTGTNFVISRRALRYHVVQFGTSLTKFIPDEIMEATPRQLEIFWRYYWLGDGSSERDRVYTSSRRMADQLVEIAQKLGKSASVIARVPTRALKFADGRTVQAENCSTNYMVSVRSTSAMTVRHSEEMYAGKIRCVSVPNEFLYVRRNGKPAWCGNTIKVLIGEDGRIPLPDDGPAYQQILHGVPAADFYLDELMYLPRNVRSNSLYGRSPVEQILMTVNIALRRDVMNLNYYDSGTLPDSFGTLPKDWMPDQIKQFQDYFDALMRGNLARRRMLKFMPADFKYTEVRPPPLKDMYDEWLCRIIYAAFSVQPSGMVSDVNRATAQTLQVQASHEGIGPMKSWVKELFDHVIQELIGFRDLEFRWQGADEVDPLEQAQALQILVGASIKTADEARVELGLPPLTAEQQAQMRADAAAKAPGGGKPGEPGAEGKPAVSGSPAEPVTPSAPDETGKMMARVLHLLEKLDARGAAPVAKADVNAAGVMLRAPSGKVLFLLRSKKGGDAGGTWAFPGGGVEEGETHPQAVARECSEEIGYTPDVADLTHAHTGSNGYQTFASDAEDEFEPKLNHEHNAYLWADPSSPPGPLHPGVKETLTQLGHIGDASKFAKFNANHDARGRFASGAGGAPSSAAYDADAKKWKLSNGADLPEHLQGVKIPPGWKNVEVNHDPKGDLQVVGTDAKGRGQAIYSDAHWAESAAAKYARVNEMHAKFEDMMAENAANAAKGDEKLAHHADAVETVAKMGIRPGSDVDTGAEKKAFGATTLVGSHIVHDGDSVRLRFVGKKGVNLDLPVHDKALAAKLAVRAKDAGPFGRLFPGVSDSSLRDYVHSLDGGDFKVKDFRTRLANDVAMKQVAGMKAPTDAKSYKKAVTDVAKAVSTKLGNTPSVALASYINPSVFSSWRMAAHV